MLEITDNHLNIFKQIKVRFLSKTKVPKEDNWRSWTNNKIWIEMVIQVIAVGGSKPADEFKNNKQLQNQVSFEKLIKIEDEDELKAKIHQVLLAVHTRYVGEEISNNRKINALAKNLKQLKDYKSGPTGLFEELSKQNEKRKIEYLQKTFEKGYLGLKGSRDYLMEAGFVRNAVALDLRIKDVFEKMGIKFPKNFNSKPELYDEVENDILVKICRPLELLGVQFDRMLYQNQKEILKML